MTSFENFSVVADLIFGLVMLVYGFAAGLFVAGWVLRKSANTKAEGRRQKAEILTTKYTNHTKCEPHGPTIFNHEIHLLHEK